MTKRVLKHMLRRRYLVIPRTPPLGQLRRCKRWNTSMMPTPMAHHGSTSQIWLPSHLKEGRKTFGIHERWTPSEFTCACTVREFFVTSPEIPTRPSYATLAGGPLLTQPARK
ncbi:hypothetical protein M9H77_18112 [Catharanthus roseus]|uniref:Uncharacterized protein n=1 Tax=Catharanthus roseus TaxID=4058 RepID=A0ACC0B6K7_CATRO|nr:hypothetical protein M9H77_18112 [Catharanthus roseus]